MAIALTIDGKKLTAEPGKTILEVAQEHGIYIPTLCYHPSLLPIGSCRLCVVEIDGADQPMTACTTLIQDGMVVRTWSERLEHIRLDALKLILINHPLDCPQCDAGGWCELQRLVFEFGIDEQEYQATRAPRGMNEFATPVISQWRDRCVMCLRCIRADHEIVRTHAIDLIGTGYQAAIGIMNPDLCISCGECLRVCPVGALTERVSRIKARQWQQEKVPTTCNYCSLGCQLELNVFENKVVAVTTNDEKGTNRGSLCVRGKFGYDFIQHEDRFTMPHIRMNGSLREVAWEQALSHVAAVLNKIALSSGPEAVGGLISPRATNEEAYIFQKFIREVVGSESIDTSGRLCIEPYRLALRDIFGRDYLPNTLDDIADSDCIVVAGGDLDRDNLIIAANLIRKALWRNDARLIVIHPRRSRLVDEADCWLCVRPRDETVLVNGLLRLLLEMGAEAWGAAAGEIEGLEALKEATTQFTPEYVERVTSVSADLLREAGQYLGEAKRPVFVCSPPLGQQPHGVDQAKNFMNLALLCGALAEGGGIHFVGPQSNMVGVVEMGAASGLLPGYKPSDGKGLFALEMFRAAAEGSVKALFIVGEDPLCFLPKAVVEEGLKSLDLLVVHDMYSTGMTERAHVVLPALSFAEVDGTYTSCEGTVQRLHKALEPPKGVRWIGEILADLSAYMGKELQVMTPAAVFEEIKGACPQYKTLNFEATGFQVRGEAGDEVLKQAAFRPVEAVQEEREPGYPFLLCMEGLFFNHAIGFGPHLRAAGLARVYQAAHLEMRGEEAREMGIDDGERVRLVTPWGTVELEVKCVEEIQKGVLFLYLSHYQVDAAELIDPHVDPVSGVPSYGGIPARVDKI